MARHRDPRELAEFKGADKKNPQRYADVVPKNQNPLGNPPEYLTEEEVKCWHELEDMALPGVVTASERWIFEITASLMAQFRADREAFPASKHSVLKGHMASLGLNPSDRQRLGTEGRNDEEFNEF